MSKPSLYSPVPGVLLRFSFALLTGFSGYMFCRSLAPPNPLPTNYEKKGEGGGEPVDTVSTRQSWALLSFFRVVSMFMISWQAVLIAFPGYPVAPRPPKAHPLNATLLTWNLPSALVLTVIVVGSAVRLQSFTGLGSNFTFQLKKPSHLEKTGLYRYVQHPSYTGVLLGFIPVVWWFLRCDGIAGTILPVFILDQQHILWNWVPASALTLFALFAMRRRVQEEESMLQSIFGDEWKEWHKRTSRFVPGLF